MFGASNAFGQFSNSPFGSPSAFGQTNNANSSPFAAKPLGITSPFGAQTESSNFGGTSTGVFGTPSSSPIGSTSVFGASSSPAFESSTPAFGTSSSPAFGTASPSPFGGSSVSEQNPASDRIGFTQESGPAMREFGTPPLEASSETGATSAPASASSSSVTPAFGDSSTPASGSNSTPAFGSTGSAFGDSNSPFGSTTPALWTSPTPAYYSTGSSFSFASAPAFAHSPTPFGVPAIPVSPFSRSPFAAQSSPFGPRPTTPAFENHGFVRFNQLPMGSRVYSYACTPEVDCGIGTQPAKLVSISAMPPYNGKTYPLYSDSVKSHEELRWEDYQLGDKGGPNPAVQSSTFSTPTAPFSFNPSGQKTSTFGTPSSTPTPFGPPTSNPFASVQSQTQSGNFPCSVYYATPSQPSFGKPNTSNPFWTAPAQIPAAYFPTLSDPFNTPPSRSLFGTPNTSGFGTPISIFGTTQAQGTTSSFANGINPGTQSANLFQSSSTARGQTSSPFWQSSPFRPPAGSPFDQAAPYNVQSAPPFSQSNAFARTSTPITPSVTSPFQSAQVTQNPAGYFVAQTGGVGGFNQSFEQMFTNMFGALQAMRQMSTTVAGEPAPMRLSCMSSNDISFMMLEFQNLKL